jgi:hypothetical protein
LVDLERIVGEMDLVQRHHALAAAIGLRKLDVDFFVRGLRCVENIHALDLLQLALRLGRLARLRAEAGGKIAQLLDFSLLIFVGGEMLLLARLALLDVGIVVAAVAMDLFVADLENIIDERIQECAIVRDHENCAGIVLQIVLEPAE